jgi:hypothetical protein
LSLCFERFLRNFTRERIPKGERLEVLTVEVILSPTNRPGVSLFPWAFRSFMLVPNAAAPDVIGSFLV